MRGSKFLFQSVLVALVCLVFTRASKAAAYGVELLTGDNPTNASEVSTGTVTSYHLFSNTSGQVIDIYAAFNAGTSGFTSASSQGFDFFIQIGNGGSAPSITAVNLLPTSGLYTSSSTYTLSPSEYNSSPQIWQASGSTSSGSVTITTTPVLLGTVTINTQGYSSGTYSLSLINTPIGGSTDLGNITTFYNNPNTSIIVSSTPEPSALALFGLVIPCLLKRRRTR